MAPFGIGSLKTFVNTALATERARQSEHSWFSLCVRAELSIREGVSMRCSTLGMAMVMSLFAFQSAAQGWMEFVDRDEFFGANLPHDPAVAAITYLSEFGAEYPGKVYTASDGQVEYKITVVDYALSSELEGSRGVWDFAGSVAYAAWDIRKRGGEITHDGWTEADRIPGHQLQITNDDGSRTYAQIHSFAMRLYIFEAHASPGATPPIQYQQSVVFLDEEGEIVRYDTDFRTRIDPGR